MKTYTYFHVHKMLNHNADGNYVIISLPVTTLSENSYKKDSFEITKTVSNKKFRRLLSTRLRDREYIYLTLVVPCNISLEMENETHRITQMIEEETLATLETLEKSCVISQIGKASFVLLHGVEERTLIEKVLSALLSNLKDKKLYLNEPRDILVLTFKVGIDAVNSVHAAQEIFNVLRNEVVEVIENNPSYKNITTLLQQDVFPGVFKGEKENTPDNSYYYRNRDSN